MRGKLYTSYFAKLKYGKGYKISIALYNPKWITEKHIDFWFKELAPDKLLLNDYKYRGISWDEYTNRYFNSIKSKGKGKLEIGSIKKLLDKGHDITIYCYEKPGDNCHRHLLGKMFMDMGYEVEEL